MAGLVTTYLSLGSNLGDRAANLARALSELRGLGRITAVSSLYETEPMEVTDQPWFLNCAAALQTELGAIELLHAILKIEQTMGRHRTVLKGPRIIDIDLLLYADSVIDTAELTVPHPAMHQRRFVLAPMAEIAPELLHPVLHGTMRELLASLPAGAGAAKRLELR